MTYCVLLLQVAKFSKISGTNGLQTLRKFGIFLMSHIIKDECLSLCSWKGIKGCQKIPFVKYTRVRELIYNTVILADKTCTYKDVDEFLQQSVVKHSNQRLKRKKRKYYRYLYQNTSLSK